MEAEGGTPEASQRVHVRRLDVADTLRWAWYALTDHLELVALTFAVQLLSVATTLGISVDATTEAPTIADWVWPVWLVYFGSLGVAWSAYYLTAADEVAERSRSLGERVGIAARRLPALVVATLLLWSPVVVWSALFAFVPVESVWVPILVVSVLPGLYLMVRLVLIYPACVIDRKGPLSGLTTSWRASRGSGWKIFGVTVAYAVLTYGSGIVAGVFGGAYSAVGTAVSAVFGSALGPLYGLALGHLYLEGSRNR